MALLNSRIYLISIHHNQGTCTGKRTCYEQIFIVMEQVEFEQKLVFVLTLNDYKLSMMIFGRETYSQILTIILNDKYFQATT